MSLEKINHWFGTRLIPCLTGSAKAPYVYVSNAFYLNWYQLGKSIQQTKKSAKGICIDIGAGCAPYYSMLVDEVDEYIITDYAPTHTSMFKDDKTSFVEADILNLPFKENYADTVLLTQVLEHVVDPHKALDEVRRVLKEDGILMISVPFIYQAHALPHDYWRFSEYGLRQLLETYNFEILEFYYQGYIGTTVMSIFNGFLWEVSSRKKSFRNLVLLPFLLLIFSINNMLGRILDVYKAPSFSPNFFVLCRLKKESR